jgi:ribonuclease D
MRETTYYPQLCLIQLASPDEVLTVDPLADSLDLAPFFSLMNDTKVVKVFHAARQDVEITYTLANCIPTPLFDTQVAAMVCGYGESVSYEQLVNDIAKAKIDKSSRFTDWSRRPLSDAQLTYAAADVAHLRAVYLTLRKQLEESSRVRWLDEEMAVLTSPGTYRLAPEDAWQRFRGRLRKPREIAIMMEVAAWREEEAQRRDVPRARVLKDDALMDLATRAPRSADALADLRSLPKGFERSRSGDRILQAIARGMEKDPARLPRIERSRHRSANGATVELLKVLLRMVSEEARVAPKILATVEDLEAIAAGDPEVPALHGWRQEIFGARALELKAGRLALALQGSRVVAWAVDRATPAAG